ncbi:MAG: ATP-binding protein, partial [bacterium]
MDADAPARIAGPILCPVIIGRDAERTVVRDALNQAKTGNGSLLLIAGEAGIGKSRLTRDADEQARGMGMRVLRGRAVPGAGPIPFRPLAEAIHGALRRDGPPQDSDLEPFRPALRGLVPQWSGTRVVKPSPMLLYEGVVRLLRALAGEEGLLLVLEDVQWADADTLAVVDHLADNLASERVLCVATIRDEPGAALDAVEAIAARRGATKLTLQRLTFDETADMARRALDKTVLPRALMEALAERAEGVPFVVEEMLSAYATTGTPATLPHTYRELVRSRLATLDEGVRQTLYAAAAMGRRFEWTLLTAITGATREKVLNDLRAAVAAQLVVAERGAGFEVPFGFRHSLVREALLAELLPPELAELSVRTAEAIEDSYPGVPGDWCERAADLRASGGDGAAAARLL